MSSLNKAQVIGNLGADPEVRSTSSGTQVATPSIAKNRRWTDDTGEEQERTEWHRVAAWDRMAEITQKYLSQGDRVYVEGRIEYRTWTGGNGQKRHTTESRAHRLLMLEAPDGQNRQEPDSQRQPAAAKRGQEEFSEESSRSDQRRS